MAVVKTNCDDLFRKFYDWTFIFDDESYFTLTQSMFNNNVANYTSEVFTTQPIIELVTKAKFKDKILVWISIGLKGFSHLFIQKHGFAINGQRTIENHWTIEQKMNHFHLKKSICRCLIYYILSKDNGGDCVLCLNVATRRYNNIVLRLFCQ